MQLKGSQRVRQMSKVMHLDEFIFNCCVSSMISDDTPADTSSESAMNVFSIDENKIRDANGIIFAEAITCYKCTFCGKMFAAMEVVLTHYQSNHRCSVIPLLKGMHQLNHSLVDFNFDNLFGRCVQNIYTESQNSETSPNLFGTKEERTLRPLRTY